MSKNKLTPLQVVERYHDKYVKYEEAFNKNPFNEEDMKAELQKIAESNVDLESEEFLDKMMDILIEKPQKRADVNNAALRFVLFTDFYILTQEEELPENILKDYNSLPIKDSIKPYFSIKGGEFVKNEEGEIPEDMKVYFREVYKQIKAQQKQ